MRDRYGGSSPLARGLLPVGVPDADRLGIIPARAGFTFSGGSPVRGNKDHPRSRGVYRFPPANSNRTRGSSPLARGLRRAILRLLDQTRIIPARAGFTVIVFLIICSWWDHPRSRGVYYMALRATGMGEGSSPLARGLLHGLSREGRRTRIIPARAGFTSEYSGGSNLWRDHPRSRGVYLLPLHRGRRGNGSSPLARGLQIMVVARHAARGIIPARAGFTSISI